MPDDSDNRRSEDESTVSLSLPEGEPERIGPYKILQELGEGGMGVVYLAEQTEPIRRRVALKLIKLGMDSKHAIARFAAERQALALRHRAQLPGAAEIREAVERRGAEREGSGGAASVFGANNVLLVGRLSLPGAMPNG